MAEKQFLVMAWKWHSAVTKVMEPDESRSTRIRFNTASMFAENKPKYKGDGVLAKMKELAFDEMEAGRPKPGFAIVKQSQLDECQRARDVKVIGDVDALNNGLMRARKVPEPEQEAQVIDLPTMPEEPLAQGNEKYDCEYCARKGFNRKSYAIHLDKFHLRTFRNKKELTAVEQSEWDAISGRIEELRSG